MASTTKVIIIGSGLGGLSLAQSLRRSNIPFEIYERDASPFERAQGYRLHLDGDAINTVAEVLTPELQAVFNKTSHFTQPYTDIMKADSVRVVKRLPTKDDLGSGVWPKEDDDAIPLHANVDRATLREILLTGLEAFIRFGKKFERYESSNLGVKAHFADGTVATGTVLVGADGVSSKVRQQRAPSSRNMDAGITAIYGRVPMHIMKDFGSEEVLNDIFTIASDSRKVFLGLGSVIFPTPPDEAAKGVAKLSPKESYSVCIVGGRHQFFPENTRHATPEQLQKTAAELVSTSEWSEKAAPLIRSAEPESFFSVHMQTSVPSEMSPPSNVTLLGDAIHAMTPSLGRGANLAMRHGALLGRHLKKAAADGGDLAKELAAYERSMIEYGFGVVREAAAVGNQRMAQTPLE